MLASSAILLFAAYWALRIGWASYLYHQATPDSIRQAAQWAPMNADYQFRAGNLRRAVELNPYMAAAWIQLALAAEAEGSHAEAERLFLQAAKVDRTFEPRWILANFYFRRNRPGPFWEWIRLAAEQSYGSRDALFRLCWRMTRDGEQILEKGIPADAGILCDYVEFLVAEKKLEEAVRAATKLLAQATAAHRGTCIRLIESLIEMGNTAAAVRLWNGLIRRGLIAFEPLDPPAGRLLTNADLAVEPSGKGFDWRLYWRAGIETFYTPQRQLRITLSGKQEAFTELLSQVAPLHGPGWFRFQYRYRSEGIPQPCGLSWRIWDLRRGRWLQHRSELIAGAGWRRQEFRFPLSEGAGPVKLTLAYERANGTMRAEGVLIMDGAFRLDPVKQP